MVLLPLAVLGTKKLEQSERIREKKENRIILFLPS
jgi:hypothetical protein